jgi:hypothetical protein
VLLIAGVVTAGAVARYNRETMATQGTFILADIGGRCVILSDLYECALEMASPRRNLEWGERPDAMAAFLLRRSASIAGAVHGN